METDTIHPDMAEVDALARELFGTDRYQRRIAELTGMDKTAVNAWFTGRTSKPPPWLLPFMRAHVLAKQAADAREELTRAHAALERVIQNFGSS